MHYFGKKMHKTKVFLHKSENSLERDSDLIRIYVGICNKVVFIASFCADFFYCLLKKMQLFV